MVVVFDLIDDWDSSLNVPFWDAALYYVNVCFHFASLLMGFVVF